jgi:hypothetical protein
VGDGPLSNFYVSSWVLQHRQNRIATGKDRMPSSFCCLVDGSGEEFLDCQSFMKNTLLLKGNEVAPYDFQTALVIRFLSHLLVFFRPYPFQSFLSLLSVELFVM